MRLDIPSFLLGYGAGAGTVLLAKRVRPVLLELATTAYRFLDAVAARAAMTQEDLEDLLSEAKARARATVGAAREPEAEPEARA